MPYSYKLNVFLTQTGVVLFLKVAHPPPPQRWPNSPLGGNTPQVGDHCSRSYVPPIEEGHECTGHYGMSHPLLKVEG